MEAIQTHCDGDIGIKGRQLEFMFQWRVMWLVGNNTHSRCDIFKWTIDTFTQGMRIPG